MFTGFNDATVDFMWGIRFNNERSWFEAHKQSYLDDFYRPMRELGGEVYDFLSAQRPDDDMQLKVTRIYRDARRLHGRGPYKDHLWLSVEQPTEDWTDKPAFWFELSPDGVGWGLGMWCRPVTMAKVRQRINREPEKMQALMQLLSTQNEFQLDESQQYKRPKASAPSPDLAVWFQNKSVGFTHFEPLSEALYTHDLADRVMEGYRFLLPFYDYLKLIPGDPNPPEYC